MRRLNQMSIAARVLSIVALATFATLVLGEDDFPSLARTRKHAVHG